ncbi:MAG: hypothetical protein ACREJB_12720 [Planctomycetaceae bacterium]
MSAVEQSFDFSAAMNRLCVDITGRVDEFAQIDMRHVAVTFAQARRRALHGLQAKLTPMRFENGALTTHRDGRTWTVQRLYHADHEILYILTFYLPRFLNHPFREKLVTIFHELYHVSPQFDGDIRRHDGRYHVHTHSQQDYDREMDRLVTDYLTAGPPAELLTFLRRPFRTLQRQYGGVVGLQIPIPKLVLVPDSKSA